jgi:hypothetical protein
LQFAKHLKVQGDRTGAVWWVGWCPIMALGAGCLLLLPGFRKYYHILWQVSEQVWILNGKIEDWWSKDIRVLFLPPLTSIHVKK